MALRLYNPKTSSLKQTYFLHNFQLLKQKKLLLCSSSEMAIATTGLSSSIRGSWTSSITGDDYNSKIGNSFPVRVRVPKRVRFNPVMKNVNEGKGIFAPIVVVIRDIVGKKQFNQLRGKAIALHSQVINEFCKSIGADGKQRQGLIRLAKKNGEKLGFLA